MSPLIRNDQHLYSVFKHEYVQQLYSRWTPEEDTLLRDAVANFGTRKWSCVSKKIPGRTAVQCSTRWMGALNPNIRKGKWSKEENKALYETVHFYQKLSANDPNQPLPWNLISENVPCRNGIQCQARWTETLDPNIRKGRWSVDEDELLFEAKKKYGCCWVRVATMIPTRTQRQCRTRWNQLQSRKLSLENRFVKLFTENTSNSEAYSQRVMKLPEPTYFPSLEIDKLLSLPQSLLVSPDYSSSAYSFDDALESFNIEMPLPVSYQSNYLCRKTSLDIMHYNFTPQALDSENNLHIV